MIVLDLVHLSFYITADALSQFHESTVSFFADPVVLAPPNVTVVRNTITIEWTGSFDLRSLLEEYSVEENLIQAYTGNKLSVVRPNREVGGMTIIQSNINFCIAFNIPNNR